MRPVQLIAAMPLYLQTLVAMLLGVVVGVVFGPKAATLSVLAQMIITVIKAFATPLLFMTIFESILDSQFRGQGVRRLFVVCLINVVAAMAIALFLIDVLHPGAWLADIVQAGLNGAAPPAAIKNLSWSDAAKGIIPDSIVQPFALNHVPAIIILALLFGAAFRSLAHSGASYTLRGEAGDIVIQADLAVAKLRAAVHVALQVLLRVLHFVTLLIPISVFAAVSAAVGNQGIAVFKGLLVYVLVCCGGMLLHIAVVYQAWVKLYAGRSLRAFWHACRAPALHSFGINSSLATLPMTLHALDELKVSPGSARLSACVGTNFNNDGILLYQVVAVLMIAQALGIDLSLGQQIGLACLCLVATLGVAGFPEAGVIALTIVMSTAKLPIELIPLLLGVDWLVARLRSVTNVLGDITVAIAIDARPPGNRV